MKKIISLTLVVVMIALALTSCATTLSGTYSTAAGSTSTVGGSVTYTFSGSKFTCVTEAGALGFTKEVTTKGTYEIVKGDDGAEKIVITTVSDDGSKNSITSSFSQDKSAKTITIGGVTLTKK